MKLHYVAAGALLLGTSALAWQAEPQSAEVAAATIEAKDAAVEAAPAAESVAVEEPVLQPASAETWSDQAEPPAAAPAAIATLDTSTRPATQNYPPCDPGPGDDNCIQLYEPGVRTALASWNQPTGGLIDGQTAATAMGGPYEPVAGESADMAMAGDGVVDPSAGETASAELASTSDYAGVGGPIAETGYPPCQPGPGDDRCIQLYERGVTGAGN